MMRGIFMFFVLFLMGLSLPVWAALTEGDTSDKGVVSTEEAGDKKKEEGKSVQNQEEVDACKEYFKSCSEAAKKKLEEKKLQVASCLIHSETGKNPCGDKDGKTRKLAADTKAFIDKCVRETGRSEKYCATVALIENGGKLYGCTGSNCGIFQFNNKDICRWCKHMCGTSAQDPEANTCAFVNETNSNAQTLRNLLGREPSDGELYLCHQQGLGGCKALLSNPNVPAWQALCSAGLYGGNTSTCYKAVAGNLPSSLRGSASNITAGSFASLWISKGNGDASGFVYAGASGGDNSFFGGSNQIGNMLGGNTGGGFGSFFPTSAQTGYGNGMAGGYGVNNYGTGGYDTTGGYQQYSSAPPVVGTSTDSGNFYDAPPVVPPANNGGTSTNGTLTGNTNTTGSNGTTSSNHNGNGTGSSSNDTQNSGNSTGSSSSGSNASGGTSGGNTSTGAASAGGNASSGAAASGGISTGSTSAGASSSNGSGGIVVGSTSTRAVVASTGAVATEEVDSTGGISFGGDTPSVRSLSVGAVSLGQDEVDAGTVSSPVPSASAAGGAGEVDAPAPAVSSMVRGVDLVTLGLRNERSIAAFCADPDSLAYADKAFVNALCAR